MKRLTAGLLLLILLFLTGCTFGRDTRRHYGKYPEYFSIPINSMLGITGSEMDDIEILEKDSKGRVMFAFISWGSNIDTKADGIIDNPELYSIIICQKTDSEYSYYYPDYHFVAAHTKKEITKDQIAALKIRNDWEKDINESKMTKVGIVRNKKQNNSGGSRKEKIFKGKVDFENETLSFIGFGKDKDNRWLYFVRVLDNVSNYKRSYMLILNKDYSYKDSYLQQVDDVWNYQEQLKKFKELNNWSLYVK